MFGGEDIGFDAFQRDYCQTLQNKTAIDDCQRKEDHEVMMFLLVVVLAIPALMGIFAAFAFCCAYLDKMFEGGKVETGGDEEAGVDEKTALLGNEKI